MSRSLRPRAGRDGEPANAVLFYRHQDLRLRRFFASGGVKDDDGGGVRALRDSVGYKTRGLASFSSEGCSTASQCAERAAPACQK